MPYFWSINQSTVSCIKSFAIITIRISIAIYIYIYIWFYHWLVLLPYIIIGIHLLLFFSSSNQLFLSILPIRCRGLHRCGGLVCLWAGPAGRLGWSIPLWTILHDKRMPSHVWLLLNGDFNRQRMDLVQLEYLSRYYAIWHQHRRIGILLVISIQ